MFLLDCWLFVGVPIAGEFVLFELPSKPFNGEPQYSQKYAVAEAVLPQNQQFVVESTFSSTARSPLPQPTSASTNVNTKVSANNFFISFFSL
jgi:hypothetical protein